MIKTQLLKHGRPYGVKGIAFNGCVAGHVKGFKGAMRHKAHAHCYPEDIWYGWICFLSHNPEKRAWRNNKPSRLFWHEVAHIWRRSWTEKKCDKWAWKKVRNIIR